MTATVHTKMPPGLSLSDFPGLGHVVEAIRRRRFRPDVTLRERAPNVEIYRDGPDGAFRIMILLEVDGHPAGIQLPPIDHETALSGGADFAEYVGVVIDHYARDFQSRPRDARSLAVS